VPTHLFLCWVGQGSLRSDIEGIYSFPPPRSTIHLPLSLDGGEMLCRPHCECNHVPHSLTL
jgi:hypothetical protein